MSLPTSFNAFLGAAFLGVISAAGMFLVEHYRQDKVRHDMAQDLARLNQELSQVRRELDQLVSKKSEKSNKTKRIRSNKKANSVVSTSTADEYLSSANLDSSDLEFYDLSDNENVNISRNLEEEIKSIDTKLEGSNLKELDESLSNLSDLCIEFPENVELLWRIGKAHKKLADIVENKEIVQEHVNKGIEACESALRLTDDSADVHKWYAILIGKRCEFESISEKLSDGFLFKKHVEKALAIKPFDGALHHMMGQFNYEIAIMKWYERKVAAAIFGEVPQASIPEALQNFVNAEKYVDYEWKSNKLMIAKCKIHTGDYQEAVEWLEKANNCPKDNGLDEKDDSEIKALLQKYNSYR